MSRIFSLKISVGRRQTLILVLLVGSFLSVNLGSAFLIVAWYVRTSLEKQVTFLKGYYDPQVVPTMLTISGASTIVVSLLGIKSAIGARLDEDDFNEKEVRSAARYILIFWVLALATAIIVCTSAAICFLEVYVLETAFGTGILNAMEKYRMNVALKAELDYLQLEYKCCGITGFRDWFNVSWVDVAFVDREMQRVAKKSSGGRYYGNDVPFSCCSLSIRRPCIDTRIEDDAYYSKYKYPDDVTLNKGGCRDALVKYFGHEILRGIGIFVIVVLLIWVMMTISGRLLHTSLTSLAEHEIPTIGWLISLGPKGKQSNKPRKRKAPSGG